MHVVYATLVFYSSPPTLSHISPPPPYQYLLPGIVHLMHQPKLQRGDGPIVSHTSLHLASGCVLFVFFMNSDIPL